MPCLGIGRKNTERMTLFGQYLVRFEYSGVFIAEDPDLEFGGRLFEFLLDPNTIRICPSIEINRLRVRLVNELFHNLDRITCPQDKAAADGLQVLGQRV